MASVCSDPPASRLESAGDVGAGGACVVTVWFFFGILGMSMTVKGRRGCRVLLLQARRRKGATKGVQTWKVELVY